MSAHPRWTRRRLIDSLQACYGAKRGGHLDVAATADGFGVSRSTVYRWIAGRDGRSAVRMPAARLEQLMLPPAEVRRAEELAGETARSIVSGLDLPRGRGVDPRWVEQHWTEPHMVVILSLPSYPRLELRQISTTRGTPEAMGKLRQRGRVVDFCMTPTKFHARVLVEEVLSRMQDWRLYPSADVVVAGRTRVWAHHPSNVFDLAAFAHELALAAPNPGRPATGDR